MFKLFIGKISQVSNVAIAPARVDLSFSSFAPNLIQNIIRDIPRVDLDLSKFSPDLVQTTNASIEPGTVNLIFSKFASRLGIMFFPDSDISDGTWTDQDEGTNLFSAISEEVIDDANYIKSSLNPNNDICEINLSNPEITPSQPFEVFYRYKNSGEARIDLIVKLIQNTTIIATWTHNDIGQSFVTASQTLSSGEFSAISDFNDLRIRFQANAS